MFQNSDQSAYRRPIPLFGGLMMSGILLTASLGGCTPSDPMDTVALR